MKTRNLRIATVFPLCAIIVSNLCTAVAQTTAFTYQGRLVDGGSPASGLYALQFSVFDAPTNGTQYGATLTMTNNAVTNGLLTATLDFGSGVFTGPDRWLQIGVRTEGSANNYAFLWPRQPLTPVPHAIYAALAGTVPTGTISSAQLAANAVGSVNVQSNAITGSKIASGQVVKSLNGLKDDVILVPGTGLSLNTSGNILQLSANVGDYWNVNGNSGTTGANFLGTLDNQPLELRVNNARALRLEPNTSSPNIIGGFAGNSVSAGVSGSTIGGGGNSGSANTVAANFGVIGGGLGNVIRSGTVYGTISGGANNIIDTNANDSVIGGGANSIIQAAAVDSVISGGWSNLIGSNSFSSVIGGGSFNSISATAAASSIAGGRGNKILANAIRATIGGGVSNTNSSPQATIGGGANNFIQTNASNATIAGGVGNLAGANNAAIIGGSQNTVSGDNATVAGGYLNAASGPDSFIGGGNQNQATNFADTVSGGFQNNASGGAAFVGGGYLNSASGWRAAIAGGMGNNAAGETSFIGAGNSNTAYTNSFIGAGYLNVADLNSVIGGGNENVATNTWCVVGGGSKNKAVGYTSTIAGGIYNTASAQNAVVGGGQGNTASGYSSTVTAGEANTASGFRSTVSGGYLNVATGQYSAVPGGYNNAATNNFSFAAGRCAKANHLGAFVWADSTDADVASTTNNQFVVRASGGAVFYSDPTAAFGAYLPPGGGAFSSLSDQNAKTNFTVVDGRAVLERLAALPIATWNYKSQRESVRHMGAMAQDFAAAFGIGEDERHISTVDADGVALAAIQGLNQKFQDELKRRDAENAELKLRLEAMEKLLDQLSKK